MHKLAIASAIFGVLLMILAVFMYRTVPAENWASKALADSAIGACVGSFGLGVFFSLYGWLIYRRD